MKINYIINLIIGYAFLINSTSFSQQFFYITTGIDIAKTEISMLDLQKHTTGDDEYNFKNDYYSRIKFNMDREFIFSSRLSGIVKMGYAAGLSNKGTYNMYYKDNFTVYPKILTYDIKERLSNFDASYGLNIGVYNGLEDDFTIGVNIIAGLSYIHVKSIIDKKEELNGYVFQRDETKGNFLGVFASGGVFAHYFIKNKLYLTSSLIYSNYYAGPSYGFEPRESLCLNFGLKFLYLD